MRQKKRERESGPACVKSQDFPSISIKNLPNAILIFIVCKSPSSLRPEFGQYESPIFFSGHFVGCFLFLFDSAMCIQKKTRSEHKPWQKKREFNYYSIIWMWSSSGTAASHIWKKNLHSLLSPWESETSTIPHPYYHTTTFYDAIETISVVPLFTLLFLLGLFYILKVKAAIGRLLCKQRLTNIAEQL